MKKNPTSLKRRRMRIDRLKALRKAKGLTQKELSDRAHISVSVYRRYEHEGSDHSDPTLEAVIRIAKVLGCSIDYLAGLQDDVQGRLMEKDLPIGLRRLLAAYRSSKRGPNKLADIIVALASDEDLLSQE